MADQIPTYQWMINGVNVVGQTASTFITSTLANGNIVSVMMTSNDPCANPTTATSNPITIHSQHLLVLIGNHNYQAPLLYAVAALLRLLLQPS
jgi:hypothetical protein